MIQFRQRAGFTREPQRVPWDPITPPEWGQSTAANLAHGYFYEFPAAGHGVAGESECARSIQHAFLNDPQNEPDASCIADEPGPEFVLPQDVAIVPGFYHTIYDIDLGNPRGRPWLEAIVVGVLILFIGELVFLLVALGALVIWWIGDWLLR